MAEAPADLAVAAWAFTAGPDPAANAAAIAAGLDAAAAAGARVAVFPECALCGYPGAARADLAGLDWCALADHEDALLLQAARLGLVAVIGTAERGPAGVLNQALVGGAVAPVRYAKRSLTPGDRAHFAPGGRPLVVAVDGWRLGLGICFDLRFAPRWAELAAQGADAFLVPAHMAGVDVDPGTKAEVVPALCRVRAAEHAAPLLLANTAAADRWCDSLAVDARGVVVGAGGAGLLLRSLRHRSRLASWYGELRKLGHC
ncbi:MAG: carbon-nitrogen hydrolase family protein [Planctomycetes bacterium]|nr:carbon-nitrogen hydrolase family protein [Planctomycetota bacterium]